MKKVCIGLIVWYQKYISPLFQILRIGECRYYPSCSHYTKEAIEKYGVKKGVVKGIKRVVSCNPLSKKQRVDLP